MKRIAVMAVLLALLSTSEAFSVTLAVNEFTSGGRIKFFTEGHPKSKGINMVLSYPSSWLAKEGEHPNVVQLFMSEKGHGLESALIITKKLQLEPGEKIVEKELREFFASSEMKNLIPPGAKFIQAKPTKIEGLPAGILEYLARGERAGLIMDVQFITYIFIYDSVMVQLQCSVTTMEPSTSAVLARKMDDFKPLFLLMANSIVLQDRWK